MRPNSAYDILLHIATQQKPLPDRVLKILHERYNAYVLKQFTNTQRALDTYENLGGVTGSKINASKKSTNKRPLPEPIRVAQNLIMRAFGDVMVQRDLPDFVALNKMAERIQNNQITLENLDEAVREINKIRKNTNLDKALAKANRTN